MKKLSVVIALLFAVLSVHAKDTKVENLTSEEYQAKFTQLVKQGFRPVEVSIQSAEGPKEVGQIARYGAVFRKVKNTPAWQARHGLTTEAYAEVFNQLT